MLVVRGNLTWSGVAGDKFEFWRLSVSVRQGSTSMTTVEEHRLIHPFPWAEMGGLDTGTLNLDNFRDRLRPWVLAVYIYCTKIIVQFHFKVSFDNKCNIITWVNLKSKNKGLIFYIMLKIMLSACYMMSFLKIIFSYTIIIKILPAITW